MKTRILLPMDKAAFAQALKGSRAKHVLVVGDIMLDTYIRGRAARLSPEAPVPVVRVEKSEIHLGGAANVAANARALGIRVTLLGIVGNDAEARSIAVLAKKLGITTKLVKDRSRPTTSKTRVAVDQNHITRLDREETGPLSQAVEREMLRAIRALPNIDMVIVSDYDKGVIHARVVNALKKQCGADRIIADVKPRHAKLFKGIHTVKVNISEAEDILAKEIRGTSAATQAVRALGSLCASNIVLTRGGAGSTVFNKKTQKVSHLPTAAREVYDVSGAGDSVIAAIAAMLAAGLSLEQAAEVGNSAGGVAVGRRGTATVLPEEIIRTLD